MSKDKFYEAINGPKLVFVQYWTAWCSECLTMDHAWETVAVNYNEKNSKIIIATVDCVLDKEICDAQKVYSSGTSKKRNKLNLLIYLFEKVTDFPTLNLYQNGKLVSTYTGAKEAKDMMQFVDIAINAKKEL